MGALRGRAGGDRESRFWREFEPDRVAWGKRRARSPMARPARLAERVRGSLARRRAERRTAELIASGRLEIGRYSYGNPELIAYAGDEARVRIGSFVSIAEEVRFVIGGNHRLERISRYPPFMLDPDHPYEPGLSKGEIIVGSDVWIARRATILSGVAIGPGAAVAAEAVVGSDVRPYAVVAGNPAREIRRRFSDEQVDALLRIAWWEWPVEEIKQHAGLLFSDSIEELISAFDPGPDSGRARA